MPLVGDARFGHVRSADLYALGEAVMPFEASGYVIVVRLSSVNCPAVDSFLQSGAADLIYAPVW